MKFWNNSTIIQSGGNTVVNGVKIDVPSGANISIINGEVLVNGKKYDGKELNGKQAVNIIIEGNVGNIKCSGSVECNDVSGYVDCGGSCTCKDVKGNVDAGGSVTCENVGGDVDAGGSIMMRR